MYETTWTGRGGEALRRRRWYERQDAIKKREPGKDLPDFFNITLERPAEAGDRMTIHPHVIGAVFNIT